MYRHFSEKQIVEWADLHRQDTSRWPTKKSEPVAGTVCETWAGVDRALVHGYLGLPDGSSLARLLWEQRADRCASYTPPLTEELILAWADAHHQATGDWPTTATGRVRLGRRHHALAAAGRTTRQAPRNTPSASITRADSRLGSAPPPETCPAAPPSHASWRNKRCPFRSAAALMKVADRNVRGAASYHVEKERRARGDSTTSEISRGFLYHGDWPKTRSWEGV
jgi:hypothetical protein